MAWHRWWCKVVSTCESLVLVWQTTSSVVVRPTLSVVLVLLELQTSLVARQRLHEND